MKNLEWRAKIEIFLQNLSRLANLAGNILFAVLVVGVIVGCGLYLSVLLTIFVVQLQS